VTRGEVSGDECQLTLTVDITGLLSSCVAFLGT
jgi:hypothetical protein